ncbi:uncharacterized protein LOC135369397 [Ornithodoros turicata]|uniref:uncharacterized protein LOC135369397 n=1 Tax=Ornithodoros turicata TaxID=34597 RepID=UPI003138AD4B
MSESTRFIAVCIFLLSYLIRGAFSETAFESNRYMDSVLTLILPRNSNLEGSDLRDFVFTVPGTSFFNPDLRAEFHDGRVTGLLPPGGLRREGDCSPPIHMDGNTHITCNISLFYLKAVYEGSIKGESLLNRNRTISVVASFPDTRANLDVISGPGVVPHVGAWTVDPINIYATFSKRLNLDSSRKRQFLAQVREHIESAMRGFFYGNLKDALQNAVMYDEPPSF